MTCMEAISVNKIWVIRNIEHGTAVLKRGASIHFGESIALK